MSEEKQAQNGGAKPSNFAITVRRAALLPSEKWTDERIGVIHKTIAPEGTGTAELAMFLSVCARYDLDPFLKEIWLAKDKGRLIILTGRDSFLKVARRDQGYEGYEADLVHEKDTFLFVRKDGDIKVVHEVEGFDRGPLVGAYCLVRKQGHPPQLVTRQLSDYEHLKHKDNWKNYPADMLLARVMTIAHRLMFHISGLYTPDELQSEEIQDTLDSHEVAKKTKSRLEELKAELMDGPAPDAEETDFEVVEETELRKEEPQAEAQASPEPEQEDAGDQKKAGRKFWALYKEHGYDQDDPAQEEARREWLDERFSKRSFAHLSASEIRVAIGLLESGLGPDRIATEAVAGDSGEMPA